MIEADWTSLVDEVWVTVVPEDAVIQRLKKRTGLSEAESRARIGAQLSTAERAKHAQVVINTDCTLEEVKAEVKRLWEKRLAGA